MVDLSKFSKDDLKKTAVEINTYLKKADEKDFDPNQTTPDAAHLEEKLGTGATISQEKETGTTKSADKINKDGFPNGDGNGNGDENGESMTQPSMAEMMQQMLTILQEMRTKIAAPQAPAAPPTDQLQMSAMPNAPTPTPSTANPTTVSNPEKKGDININVTKSLVEEVLKGMGITPSPIAQKPLVDAGHPIEKGNVGLTYSKIAKMTWSEVHDANESQIKSREFY